MFERLPTQDPILDGTVAGNLIWMFMGIKAIPWKYLFSKDKALTLMTVPESRQSVTIQAEKLAAWLGSVPPP